MSDKISPLSSHDLDDLTSEFEGSKSNVMAMNAVTAAGINKVARNYDRARLLQRRFSTSLDNGEATHQTARAAAGCSARSTWRAMWPRRP